MLGQMIELPEAISTEIHIPRGHGKLCRSGRSNSQTTHHYAGPMSRSLIVDATLSFPTITYHR